MGYIFFHWLFCWGAISVILLSGCTDATNNYMSSGSSRNTRTTSNAKAPLTKKHKAKIKKQPKIKIISADESGEFLQDRKAFYQKMEYEMDKPQYKDPLYFGHKKKPKKRPPGKQKYCKECGMKH